MATNPLLDPNTDWGDTSYSNLGNLHLGAQDGLGGNWAGQGQNLQGGGYGTSYMQNSHGLNQYGVDSLDTAKRLQQQYGGTINRGYQGHEDSYGGGEVNSEGGGRGQDEKGWGYVYTPPGEDLKSQKKISDQIGFTEKQTGLDGLSDGQMAALMVALFAGGALAGPMIAGAGETGAGLGAAEGGLGEYAGEAGYLGGTGEAGANGGLLAAEPGAEAYTGAGAGSNIGTSVSTGGAAGGGGESLATLEQGTLGGAGGGGVDTLANSTVGTTGATTAATTAAKSILPSLVKSLIGGTAKNPLGANGQGTGGGTSSNSYYGASAPTNSTVAAGNVAQQQSPQQQQIAALLLQNPDQPRFNPLAYQDAPEAPSSQSMMQKLAKQLQGEDSYYG